MALTRVHRVMPLGELSVSVPTASDTAVVAVEVNAGVDVVSCVASSLLLSMSTARPWLYDLITTAGRRFDALRFTY